MVPEYDSFLRISYLHGIMQEKVTCGSLESEIHYKYEILRITDFYEFIKSICPFIRAICSFIRATPSIVTRSFIKTTCTFFELYVHLLELHDLFLELHIHL